MNGPAHRRQAPRAGNAPASCRTGAASAGKAGLSAPDLPFPSVRRTDGCPPWSGRRKPAGTGCRVPRRPVCRGGTAPHRKRSYRRTGEGRFELSARKTGYACTHNNGGDPRRPPKLNPVDRREVPHRRDPGRPPNDAHSPSLPAECAVRRYAAVRARSPNRWAA